MIVILFRILILFAIILLLYTLFEYLRKPERQLRMAKESKQFFLIDEPNNSKKNIQIVYKGCLFDGEKYIGTTDDSFEIVDIHMTVRDPLELKGFTRDDIYFLETEILKRYPHAKIMWKHPIDKLLLTKIE